MKKLLLVLCISTLALSACGESKPSKDAVKKALNKAIGRQLGSSDASAQKKLSAYSDCVVESAYDDMSAKTLKKIIAAKTADELQSTDRSKKETAALDKAANDCQDKLKN